MKRRKRVNSNFGMFSGFNVNDFDMFSNVNAKKGKVSFGAFDPKVDKIQRSRSERARMLDSQRKAKIAKSPEQWASAPNRYDLPGVDTPIKWGFGGRGGSVFRSRLYNTFGVVSLNQKPINTYSGTITSVRKPQMTSPTKEKIIGKKTVLPTIEQIQNIVTIERKTAMKQQLTHDIQKLAKYNQSTPKQVITEKRYALDEIKAIGGQTISQIRTDARDEYDAFTPEEKKTYREWKRKVLQSEDEILGNIAQQVLKEVESEA
jgi:hypothetical protein